MGDGDTRATDASSELDGLEVVGEARPAAGEVARMHRLAQDLRNPVGSLSMAVEMVLGPLRHAIDALSGDDARRVQGTLEAMSESSRQLRQLVSDLSGLAASLGEHVFQPHEPAPVRTSPRDEPVASSADEMVRAALRRRRVLLQLSEAAWTTSAAGSPSQVLVGPAARSMLAFRSNLYELRCVFRRGTSACLVPGHICPRGLTRRRPCPFQSARATN